MNNMLPILLLLACFIISIQGDTPAPPTTPGSGLITPGGATSLPAGTATPAPPTPAIGTPAVGTPAVGTPTPPTPAKPKPKPHISRACRTWCAIHHIFDGKYNVCGTDGNTYISICKLYEAVCEYKRQGLLLQKYENGICPYDMVIRHLPKIQTQSTGAPRLSPYPKPQTTSGCNDWCLSRHIVVGKYQVCASDGNTYESVCKYGEAACEYKRQGYLLKYKVDSCPSNMVILPLERYCPRTKHCGKTSKVCGTDGHSYDDICHLNFSNCENNANVGVAYNGLCKHTIPAQDNSKACAHMCLVVKLYTIYQGIACGIDNKTYTSMCMLCHHLGFDTEKRLLMKTKGPC